MDASEDDSKRKFQPTKETQKKQNTKAPQHSSHSTSSPASPPSRDSVLLVVEGTSKSSLQP